MKRQVYIFWLFVFIGALIFQAGCAKKPLCEKVVAEVNGYSMTVDDFNYESKEIMRTGKLLGDIPSTKEDILEALITKEVLLQEAHEKGMDRQKDFMKTIELYWEQTLLKNLLTEKSKEILKKIRVYDSEIIDYYNRMKESIKTKVYVLEDKTSAEYLYTYKGDIETLLAEGNKFKSELLYVIPSKWYVLGREKSQLEASIFGIESGKKRGIDNISGKWAVMSIEERRPHEPLPLDEIRKQISRHISMQKEKTIMEEWIEDLKKKARIRINGAVLEEIP